MPDPAFEPLTREQLDEVLRLLPKDAALARDLTLTALAYLPGAEQWAARQRQQDEAAARYREKERREARAAGISIGELRRRKKAAST